MPLLTGAITALALSGSPGLPVWRDTSTLPRPYTETFTQLSPGGGPQRLYGSFSSRVALSIQSITVSDTASLSATESPVDSQEIATTDTARLSASESTQLFNFQAATDTASLSVSETISLVITGVTAKTASDTASISTTETTALAITTAVTDTASIFTSESATVDVSVEQKIVTDTASITTDEAVLLNVFAGVNAITVGDTAALTTSEAATVLEVRRIKRIALSISMQRIELEIL